MRNARHWIGEVQYFFRIRSNDPVVLETHHLAVLSEWSEPDIVVWKRSNKTVWSSLYRGQDSIVVVDISKIESVVAMVPHIGALRPRRFLVEKPGLVVMSYGDNIEQDQDDNTL
jgi:hypothetical protein